MAKKSAAKYRKETELVSECCNAPITVFFMGVRIVRCDKCQRLTEVKVKKLEKE